MTEEEIRERMTKMAEALGFELNINAIKISKIKSRMSDWRVCPCDPKNVHRYCGSRLCEYDTKENGHCHCNCFYTCKKEIDEV